MVQSEEEVLKAAQAILEQKQYQKLRNYIYVSVCNCVLFSFFPFDPHGATFGRETLQTQTEPFFPPPQINGRRRCSLCSRTDVTVRFCTLQYCALAPIPLPSFVPEKVTVCTSLLRSFVRSRPILYHRAAWDRLMFGKVVCVGVNLTGEGGSKVRWRKQGGFRLVSRSDGSKKRWEMPQIVFVESD